MKKIISFLFCVCIFTLSANAQVTIGSTLPPVQGAILDLQSSELGFVPTRVALVSLTEPDPISQHVKGMVVFNLTESLEEALHEGLYLNNGERWVRLYTKNFQNEEWFYMPSIVFNTSVVTEDGEFEEKDLWEEYERQKHLPIGHSNSNLVKNPAAPEQVFAIIPGRNDFHYYVTDYDTEVFSDIAITNDGIMTYRIIKQGNNETFLNIVFVEK